MISLLTLLACSGGAPVEEAGDASIALVYSHNVDGEIEPCG